MNLSFFFTGALHNFASNFVKVDKIFPDNLQKVDKCSDSNSDGGVVPYTVLGRLCDSGRMEGVIGTRYGPFSCEVSAVVPPGQFVPKAHVLVRYRRSGEGSRWSTEMGCQNKEWIGIQTAYHLGLGNKLWNPSVGGEFYYMVKDRRGTGSIGIKNTVLDSNGNPNGMALVVDPLMGHVSMLHMVWLGSYLKIGGKYEVNIHSLESNMGIGVGYNEKMYMQVSTDRLKLLYGIKIHRNVRLGLGWGYNFGTGKPFGGCAIEAGM